MLLPLLGRFVARLAPSSLNGRRRQRRKALRCRPTLEVLEGRCLPSVTWDSVNHPDGGSWEDANNWIDDQGMHRLPGQYDDVTIAGLNPGAIVTVNPAPYGDGAARLFFSGEAMLCVLSGGFSMGTATFDAASTFKVLGGTVSFANTTINGSFDLYGGTVYVVGPNTLNGPFDFSGGQLQNGNGGSVLLT